MRCQFSAISSVCLTLTALTCLPAVAAAQTGRPAVLVMIQNEAHAPSDLVERARREVARLFSLIDLDIDWVTHVPNPGIRRRWYR